MRNTCFALLGLALFASRAYGFDVTACGQTVPAGETGILQVDLDCSTQPGQFDVTLENRATLDLNGHSIVSAPDSESVSCSRARLCTVTGPGTLSGGFCGVCAGTATKVSNLTIQGAGYGVSAIKRVDASDVIIDDIDGDGISGERLNLTRVQVTNCDGGGIRAFRSLRATDITANECGSAGVEAGGHYRIDGLTALNNGQIPPRGGAGLLATRSGRLSNATLTGNVYTNPFMPGQLAVDIYARRRVNVANVTCDHSVGFSILSEPGAPLGYCAGD